MLKILLRPFALFICGIASILLLSYFFSPLVLAAQARPAAGTGSVSISLTGGGPVVGHPGTAVKISGQNFTPNTSVTLYLTADGDPANCVPNQAGLLPFGSLAAPTVTASGSFVTKDAKWPDNAANANSSYFVCAIGSNPDGTTTTAVSQTPFVVAQAVTIDSIDPQTVNAGGTVTVKGKFWLPVQNLKVSIAQPDAQPVVSKTVKSTGQEGQFTAALTIPGDALPGTYVVSVYAVNEQTPAMTKTQTGLNVQEAPKPTATPTTAPTATAVPSPTVDTGTPPVSSGGGDAGGIATLLIYTLGGLGVVMVIVGITMLIVYRKT